MIDRNAPIGVFDSGVGGLTVMKEIMHQIPNEKVVYFGDTARVPYGTKSKETVTKFSRQIVHFLQTRNVKAIVVACNTASAYALDELEKELFGYSSRFFRIHQSYLINGSQVEQYHSRFVVMRNREKIPIARGKRVRESKK